MKYLSALDLSGSVMYMAVADASGKVLCEKAEPMKGRDSARLSQEVEAVLQSCGASFDDVEAWTVGSGPGNFSGLRIAAALVEGIVFGRGARTRCVPSAMAVASGSCAGVSGEIGVLFDGRNRELLLYGLRSEGGKLTSSGRTAILNAEQAKAYFAEHSFAALCALECDREALEKLLPSNLQIAYAEKLAVAELLKPEYGEFNQNLTDLIYIRPSVAPKKA